MVMIERIGYSLSMESSDAKRYRSCAEKLRRDAACALSEGIRRHFLDLADSYDKLALWTDLDACLINFPLAKSQRAE